MAKKNRESKESLLICGNPCVSSRAMSEKLFKLKEGAAIIGVHPRTLQQWAEDGRIKGTRYGSLWRFRLEDLLKGTDDKKERDANRKK